MMCIFLRHLKDKIHSCIWRIWYILQCVSGGCIRSFLQVIKYVSQLDNYNFLPLAYTDMVKNKGFLPSGPSEIPTQRAQLKDIIYSLLSPCKEPDKDTGVPFKADAIIANPPAYGKISSLCIFYTILFISLFMYWLAPYFLFSL